MLGWGICRLWENLGACRKVDHMRPHMLRGCEEAFSIWKRTKHSHFRCAIY